MTSLGIDFDEYFMVIAALDENIKISLDYYSGCIEEKLKADLVTIYGPIQYGLESRLNNALSLNVQKKNHLAIVLDTDGGAAEVVERIVQIIRKFYQEITFIVPNKAMSAGTILVMSGDKIMMNYFSVLGPIDPQIFKDGKWVPALSYLEKYEEFVAKTKVPNCILSSAELILLQKFDLGELHTFQQAKNLSIHLLKKWLSQYKFKDWDETETSKKTVNYEMKEKRAEEIAEKLNDIKMWYSHARGIGMNVLRSELKLKIDDFDDDLDGKYYIKNKLD